MDTTPVVENKCESSPKVLQLIVCLGNPGERYAGTRHNTGFAVADEILRNHPYRQSAWQPGNGELYDVESTGRHFLLLKPMTYMNSSGEAVVRVTGHFGISPSEVLVVSDCLDLPLGRMRMRPGGSCGGQNGVRSILAELGTEAVPRLRVGIGRPQSGECDIIDYVLARWTSVEQDLMDVVLPQAAHVVIKAMDDGLESAMNAGNSWKADKNNAEKQGEER